MNEEMRENPNAIFFTGTFTDERIKYLCNKYGIDKKDVNEIATKEVRLFMERLNNVKCLQERLGNEEIMALRTLKKLCKLARVEVEG